MAVRGLSMIMVLTLLYGCSQAGSPTENPEKQGHVERPKTVTPEGASRQETTQQLEGNSTVRGNSSDNGGGGGQPAEITTVREGPTGKHGTGCFARADHQQATSNTKPNGKKIVFAAHPSYSSGSASASADNSTSPGATYSYADDYSIVDTNICVMNADGTGMRRLTNRPSDDASPSWSPDGKQIAFVHYSLSDAGIHVMNAGGSHEVEIYKAEDQVHPPSSGLDLDLAPTWSPDGREIAFGHQCAIYIIHADGTGTPRKLATGSECASLPAWSPDGKKIAYEVGGKHELPQCIYVMAVSSGEPDTNQRRPLTDCGTVAIDGIAWSPGGKEIAFAERTLDSSSINRVDVSSLKVTALLRLGGLNGQAQLVSEPSWSSDGKQIAYAYSFKYNDFDHYAIYKMNADASNPAPVTDVPTMWAYSPDWQPLP
jgi:Tol biopolymer transport system component